MRQMTTALVIVLAALALLGAPFASALDPESFAEVSSGVVLIKGTCRGGTSTGSGFLVGASVVMTATHVIKGCQTVRVLVKGKQWITAISSIDWRDRGSQLDVSTLKLARPVADAWQFVFRPSQVPIGAYVAALGHPLGEGTSYTNGRVLARARQLILLRILSAQGMSGGPVVDAFGRVVGVVNREFSNEPGFVTGHYTADNLIAYDISSRWAAWKVTLCKTYRHGGIDTCPNQTAPPPAPPAPPPSTSPPPPAPPPPPALQPPPAGHYSGRTSQNETFDFDVSGFSLLNLRTGQVNQSCTPPFNIWGNYTTATRAPISSDGSFHIEWSGPGAVGGQPANYHTTIDGHFSGSLAAGTLKIESSFTGSDGIFRTCTSGLVTWTASKT
jgi:hypothetical protein